MGSITTMIMDTARLHCWKTAGSTMATSGLSDLREYDLMNSIANAMLMRRVEKAKITLALSYVFNRIGQR
jgi:hypothetical protein